MNPLEISRRTFVAMSGLSPLAFAAGQKVPVGLELFSVRDALTTSLVAPIRAAQANGPHSVVLDLAHGLTERGHEVTIFAAAGSVVRGVRLAEIEVEPAAAGAAIRADGLTVATAQAALRRGFEEMFAAARPVRSEMCASRPDSERL